MTSIFVGPLIRSDESPRPASRAPVEAAYSGTELPGGPTIALALVSVESKSNRRRLVGLLTRIRPSLNTRTAWTSPRR